MAKPKSENSRPRAEMRTVEVTPSRSTKKQRGKAAISALREQLRKSDIVIRGEGRRRSTDIGELLGSDDAIEIAVRDAKVFARVHDGRLQVGEQRSSGFADVLTYFDFTDVEGAAQQFKENLAANRLIDVRATNAHGLDRL